MITLLSVCYLCFVIINIISALDNRQGFFCGGALIHENYVITAARCIRSPKIVQERYVIDSVRLGENDLRSNPDCQEENECADPVVDISVVEISVHESYAYTSSSQANDIALIRLQNPAPYTDYIRPICLPVGKLQNRNYIDFPMTVAGFGRTENATRSDVKLKVEVSGFNLNECAKIYQRSSRSNLNDKQLCAGGEGGKGACTGDSGGSLVAEEFFDESTSNYSGFSYIVGVVSFGPKDCGTVGLPGVYTRVDQYIEWILDHMKK